MRFLVESLHAELAGERPLARVRPQVDFERVRSAVPLPAQIAAELFLFATWNLASLRTGVAPERFTAHLGTEESFRGRALQVKREVSEIVLTEGLRVWFKLTFGVCWTGS